MAFTACTRPDDWDHDNPPPSMDEREKLRQYFLTLPPDQQTDGWNVMWEQQITPWDNSQPNPALIEALEQKPYLTQSPFTEDKKTRKKVLVPGCGGGYDVHLFASYGFDAYGLDASEIAIQKAEQHSREQSQEQKYKLQNPQHGRGAARFLRADFFKDDFLAETHAEGEHEGEKKFDVIYDYTFLCALPPPMRPRWAKRMSELLKPGGRLVCTEFPLSKKPQAGGPPHGLTVSRLPCLPFRLPDEVADRGRSIRCMSNCSVSRVWT